jgi:L-fuculose-phosphate aldolase
MRDGGSGGPREQLTGYAKRLLSDGLAVGSAGNLSVRHGGTVFITPSGIGYPDLQPADICEIGMHDHAQRPGGPRASTETPMHLAVYAATSAEAIVHSHSPEVIALSVSRAELPAIHYAISELGGPVRVAGYHRFGSQRLAQAAAAALNGRNAVILENHGAVTVGQNLPEAYDRAVLLEWLARVYRLALSYGSPRILSAAELGEVAAEIRRIGYGRGEPAGGARPPAAQA